MNQAIERLNRELGAMSPPLEGSCLCGAVPYVVSATPVWSGHCHCGACQKLSGAPFVSAFSVPVATFSHRGEVGQFQRPTASGNLVTTCHCAACGTRIFAKSTGNIAIVNVFATTLRDPCVFRPVGNVYLSDAANWIDPPPALFNFQTMPPRSDDRSR
jgi:hypothetical protein